MKTILGLRKRALKTIVVVVVVVVVVVIIMIIITINQLYE